MPRRFLLAASVVFTSLSALSQAAVAAEAMYELMRIEPPPGWEKIELHAVNNAGDAAGRVYNRWPYRGTPVIRHADGRIDFPPRPPECPKTASYRSVAYNDRGQMLLNGCGGGVRAWRWTPGIGWEAVKGAITTPTGMNNHGTVVGTVDRSTDSGFVWRGPDDYEIISYDGGISFHGINDEGDIAATIEHVARPDLPYDRDGVTAALIPHASGEPIPTGDKNIHTFADYKNPKRWWYHVDSAAAGINGKGQLALNSPATFDHRENYYRTSCGWYGAGRMACADLAARRDSPGSVGIDGRGNVILKSSHSYPRTYVMQPDGSVFTIGTVSDPPTTQDLVAYGVSESGFVVGRYGGHISHRSDAFILKPKR